MEKVIFVVANIGHFGFLPPTTFADTFERDTLYSFFLIFKEDKKTKKRTLTLHGHGSAPEDPVDG